MVHRGLLIALLALTATDAPASGAADIKVAQAENGGPDATVQDAAHKILRRMNINYRAVAVDGLKKKGEYFTFARIEVTGVMSGDDTYRHVTEDFDRQIKPSSSAADPDSQGKGRNVLGRVLDPIGLGGGALDVRFDLRETIAAMQGEVTEHAKKRLAPYKDKEINEIVAHSWGSELVYAAILTGELRPPKKLIAVGVPDDDFEKWKMLAARTGTEVHFARADNDLIAQEGAKLAKREAGSIDFRAKWDALCAKPGQNRCPAYNRRPTPVIREKIGHLPVTGGHDRLAYYAVLKRNKVLNGNLLALNKAVGAKIETEILLVKKAALDAALREARALIAESSAVERKRQAQLLAAEEEPREHDKLLKNRLIEIAQRSCATPGSVTQAELSILPKLYDDPGGLPQGLGDCLWVYVHLSAGERDAETIRTLSVPTQAAAIRPVQQPAVLNATIPFFPHFPRLKEFAMTACRSSEQVSLAKDLYQPRLPLSFDKGRDDSVANSSSVGLGDCERQLFHKLIEMIRAGQGGQIDGTWVRDMVALYQPVRNTSSPPGSERNDTPPASGRERDGGGESKPPSPVVRDPAGEALKQLREIERRQRWGLPPR